MVLKIFRPALAVFALALAVTAPRPSQASTVTIYQDYTAPVIPGGQYFLKGPTSGTGMVNWGFQFVAAVSGNVASIDVAIDGMTPSGPLSFELYADNGSNQLGALLDTMPSILPVPGFTSPVQFTYIQSVNNPWLAAGSKYWLVGDAADATVDAWEMPVLGGMSGNNVVSLGGTLYYDTDMGTDPAFSVEATPEPGAIALLASAALSGAGALVRTHGLRRLRRRARR